LGQVNDVLFLFPSNYFDSNQVNEFFHVEYDTVCQFPEFKAILFNYDGFVLSEQIKLQSKGYSGICIYRGWMLTPNQYFLLYNILQEKGIVLINSPEEYNACHLFPVVYDRIRGHTPNIIFFEKEKMIDWNLVNLSFTRFMIKDYVKSEKGTTFPTFFDTPVDAVEMDRYVTKFTDMRGELFTGGIVLKEYVNLKKYGENTNEHRAFYLNGQLVSVCRNSNQPDTCASVPSSFVSKFTELGSNYYTIDFAELSDGEWTIIEVGDGQVSSLPLMQSEMTYYNAIRTICYG